MLIRFFKASQPSVIFVTILLSLLIKLIGLYIHWNEPAPAFYCLELLDPLFLSLNKFTWLSFILAWLSSIGIGILVNYVFAKHDLFPRSTLLLSFLTTTFLSALPVAVYFSPLYVVVVFTIIVFHKSLQLSRSSSLESNLFDIGFLVALGSLFYQPMVVVFILGQVSLVFFARFNFRLLLVSLSGVASPFILFQSINYFFWQTELFVLDEVWLGNSFYNWGLKNVLFIAVLLTILFITYKGFTKLLRNTVRIKRSYLLGALFFITFLILFIFVERSYTTALIIPGLSMWTFGFFYGNEKPLLKDMMWLLMLSSFLFML